MTLQPPQNVGAQFSPSVTATDTVTNKTSAAQSFIVTVSKPMIPPAVGAITPASLMSGQSEAIAVPVTDVIGDPIRFSIVGAPSWITIDPNAGVISVSPPVSAGGTFFMTVFATDAVSSNLVGVGTFTANVQGVPPQLTGSSTIGSSKGISGVTLFFNEPMDPNTAGSSGDYTVLVSTSAKAKAKKSLGFSTSYNSSNNSVTLSFSKKQKFHISVVVNGGIHAQNGAPFGSTVTRFVK